MKKLVIDCSKPTRNSKRQSVVDMTSQEIDAIENSPEQPDSPPSDTEVRLTAIEAKLNITEEDKQAALAELMSASQIKGVDQ